MLVTGLFVKLVAAGMLVGVLIGILIGMQITEEIYYHKVQDAKRREQSRAKHQPPHGFNKSTLVFNNDHLSGEF